jgi:hypothetical protein
LAVKHHDPSQPRFWLFYAVTRTSVYEVKALGPGQASAIKIAADVQSGIPVGSDIAHDGMIAVGQWLQGFALGRGMNPHRVPGLISVRLWGDHTTSIAALFATREEAETCLEFQDRQLADRRWASQSRLILLKIGYHHPSFYVVRSPADDPIMSPLRV